MRKEKMMSNMEKKFEADTGKILDIVINSLYSEREIFVRELISNASDAIDKKKYLALTNKSINDTSDPFEIKIEVNSKENTIKISDNGIGMDEEDLINSLGTIARSGTKAFLEQFNKSKDERINIGKLTSYFDKFKVFCFDLDVKNMLNGSFNFLYK